LVPFREENNITRRKETFLYVTMKPCHQLIKPEFWKRKRQRKNINEALSTTSKELIA
jgi:hypothetical protein